MSRSYHAVAGNIAHSPLHGGVRVFHPTKREVGTIGCVVTRAGKPYLLSNQHVFGVATDGKPVFDSTNRAQIAHVAYTSSSVSGNDYVDAALATPTLPVSFEIPSIGILRGHTEPRVGMRIKCYGGVSGFRTGTILAVNARAPNGKTGAFVMDVPVGPGDSGTVVVDSNNMAVGLFYGSGGGVAAGCKASAIIRAYPGLSFVGRSGIVQPSPSSSQPRLQPIPSAPVSEPGLTPIGSIVTQILGQLVAFITALLK